MSTRRHAKSFPFSITGFAILTMGSLVLGRSTGALPGVNGIPSNATVGFPSCGACHGSGRPGDGGPVTVSFQGSPSISKARDAVFGLQIHSAVAGSRGGFALTSSRGTFKPTGNTQVGNLGRALSHTSSASRSWSFSFRSDQTGLVEWHAVGNTVDGDGNNKGDSWGWYGPNPSIPGTPFRVFVNDSMVFAYGKSCNGREGFAPLLGAAKNAARGQPFPVELYNVPPQTVALGLFGFSNTVYGPFQLPLSLDGLGAPGCRLNVSMDLMLPVATTGSGDGNGKAVFRWAIPNLVALQGLSIHLGALVVDRTANQLGLTNSMGLRAVIQ